MIEVGSTLPEVDFSLLVNGEMTNPGTAELFNDKRVVVFAVPGAFTPTCSQAHLPGYVALADKIKAKGVDTVICLSVNDAFVMDAWGKANNAEKIMMLADGNGHFTKQIGLDMNTGDFGGLRSMRYAMLVEDCVVKKISVEDPGRQIYRPSPVNMPKLVSITKNIDRFLRLRGFNKVDRKVLLKCNITMLKKAGQWQLYDD
jgi:peroxiredoxin